jgi:hypothetical protein
MYRNLNASLIVDTCRATQARIAARFTDSGLSKIAGEILAVSEQAAALSAWLAKPHLTLRALAGGGIVTIIAIIASVALHIKVQMTVGNIGEFLQGLDAAINEVVFIGIAAYFFISLETRLKRQRALKAIRELRSLAHIIDMHQLTKDPEHMAETPTDTSTDTVRMRKRPQNPAELIRYLDHCSDLLALISKIAALYVQDFDDPVTLVAVNEIENLTNGLSRKIWQKIMILDRILVPGQPAPIRD